MFTPQYKSAAGKNQTVSPSLFFQPKLSINKPNDIFEQEADAMADRVMRMIDYAADDQLFFKPAVSSLQRTCVHCEQEDQLQRKDTAAGGVASEEMSGQLQASKGTGHSLDGNTKDFMENGFGADFSSVSIHTDNAAVQMSRNINARAFTTGNDIYFNEGEYNTCSSEGRHLLAHELTHTIQQSGMLQRKTGCSFKSFQRESYLQHDSKLSLQRVDAVPLTAEELATRIARCIGIWETNRGKDDPAPEESTLDTVAGVHASMATIEQATMPYAITALKLHKELRDMATPPLTLKELTDAEARCTAVNTLLHLVSTAAGAGQKPNDFITANGTAISATGLSNDDVKTMFSAITLKATIDTASAEIKAIKDEKERKKKLQEKIDGISATDRLGLGESSLSAYIKKPGNWGENRAAWQRKAVGTMADNVGGRVETLAIANNGTSLASFVVKDRVNAELVKNPVPAQDEIIKTVAQQNNPKEADYGKHVLETYNRLYP